MISQPARYSKSFILFPGFAAGCSCAVSTSASSRYCLATLGLLASIRAVGILCLLCALLSLSSNHESDSFLKVYSWLIPSFMLYLLKGGGEWEIRTPGAVTHATLAKWYIKPLCQLSVFK